MFWRETLVRVGGSEDKTSGSIEEWPMSRVWRQLSCLRVKINDFVIGTKELRNSDSNLAGQVKGSSSSRDRILKLRLLRQDGK